MFSREEAEKHFGKLTPEQEACLEEAAGGRIGEKELFEKLGVEEERFAAYLKSQAKKKESAGFAQKVDENELRETAGGQENVLCGMGVMDVCMDNLYRPIHEDPPGFPNCAATVENGSWCSSNDACYSDAVRYYPLWECSKAWK